MLCEAVKVDGLMRSRSTHLNFLKKREQHGEGDISVSKKSHWLVEI